MNIFIFRFFQWNEIHFTNHIDAFKSYRLDWESSVLRGCSAMRRMEEDRLCQLRNLAEQYHQIMSENRPKLVASSKRLSEPIELCDISRDMEAVKKKVRKRDLL